MPHTFVPVNKGNPIYYLTHFCKTNFFKFGEDTHVIGWIHCKHAEFSSFPTSEKSNTSQYAKCLNGCRQYCYTWLSCTMFNFPSERTTGKVVPHHVKLTCKVDLSLRVDWDCHIYLSLSLWKECILKTIYWIHYYRSIETLYDALRTYTCMILTRILPTLLGFLFVQRSMEKNNKMRYCSEFTS